MKRQLRRGDRVKLKPGASTYTGPAEVRGFLTHGVLVRRPDGTSWIWPREWIADGHP